MGSEGSCGEVLRFLERLPIVEVEAGTGVLEVGGEPRGVRSFERSCLVPAGVPSDVLPVVFEHLLGGVAEEMRQHGVEALVGSPRIVVEPVVEDVEVPRSGLLRLFERVRLIGPRRERVLVGHIIRLVGRAV